MTQNPLIRILDAQKARQFPNLIIDVSDMLSWRYQAGGRATRSDDRTASTYGLVDCSGATIEVFRRAGLEVADTKTGEEYIATGTIVPAEGPHQLLDLAIIPRTVTARGIRSHIAPVVSLGPVRFLNFADAAAGLISEANLKYLAAGAGVQYYRLRPGLIDELLAALDTKEVPCAL